MLRLVSRATLTLLVFLTISTAIMVSPVYAESLEGKFVQYTFDYARADTVNGNVREEVLSEFDNGTSRVRLSGNIGSTTFDVAKNVPTEKVMFPNLDAVPRGSYTFENERVRITAEFKLIGQETVQFKGEEHTVDVFDFSLQAEAINATKPFNGSFTGTAKSFISGLVYSLDAVGDITKSDRTRSLSVIVQATDTNLDVDNEGTASNQATLGSLATIFAAEPSAEFSRTYPETNDAYPLPIIAGLVAVGALGAALFARSRRKTDARRESSAGEKPQHWVYLLNRLM